MLALYKHNSNVFTFAIFPSVNNFYISLYCSDFSGCLHSLVCLIFLYIFFHSVFDNIL